MDGKDTHQLPRNNDIWDVGRKRKETEWNQDWVQSGSCPHQHFLYVSNVSIRKKPPKPNVDKTPPSHLNLYRSIEGVRMVGFTLWYKWVKQLTQCNYRIQLVSFWPQRWILYPICVNFCWSINSSLSFKLSVHRMTSPKHSASSGHAGPHTDNTESLLEGSDNEASCRSESLPVTHSTRSSRGLSAFPGKIDYTYLLEECHN